MYESPITTMITDVADNIARQFAEQTENMVYQEVRHIGVHVDKEELVKALQYDRHQYEKGYEEALTDALSALCSECSVMQNGGKCSKCEQYHAILSMILGDRKNE